MSVLLSARTSNACREDGCRLEVWQISIGSTVCTAAMIELRTLTKCYSFGFSHHLCECVCVCVFVFVGVCVCACVFDLL